MFDIVEVSKGAAILRMMEYEIGPIDIYIGLTVRRRLFKSLNAVRLKSNECYLYHKELFEDERRKRNRKCRLSLERSR